MIPFLIIALIIAILVIWGLATHNTNVDEQVNTRIKSEKEKLLKENEELKNRYQALWNLKNKIIDENTAYRNQLKLLSNRPNKGPSDAIISENVSLQNEIADLKLQLDDYRNKYEALQNLKDKIVDENSQLRHMIKKQDDVHQLQNELLQVKQLNRLQEKEIEKFKLKAESTQDILVSVKSQLSSALADNQRLLKENLLTDQIKERIDTISLLPFAQIPEDFKESILSGRLANAFNSTDLFIDGNLFISANISSRENTYKTSLFSCSCPDYVNRHKPCKHMLFLSYTSGLMLLNKEVLSSLAKNNLFKLNMKIEQEKEEALNAKKQNRILQRNKRDLLQLSDRIQKELDQSYPWLAGMYKRFQIEQDNHDAYMLSNRSTTSKDIVKKLKKKNAQLKYEKSLYENQLLVYESLFPWLEEFKKVNVDKAVEYVRETQSDKEYDRISDYLSPAEYKTLSTAQKSQLALERYKKHRKSDWEIGIDYERYIGYRYEIDGYKVSYTGAIDYLKDMGRDLICEKGDEILVIQCKRWSTRKTIHEKHVFQLFGSTIQFKYKNPGLTYKPILYTTTKLSDVAVYCAEQLGVEVVEQEKYVDYPCIKCNISKTGEKIYHLPFDQQYDRISIDADKGEFYAMTASEAEEKGFRRAFRHHA